MLSLLRRLTPDRFTQALIATVLLATVLPASGVAAVAVDRVGDAAVFLLFFLYGLRLSGEAVMGGIVRWRLHLLIFACTFVMFPLIGLALKPVAPLLMAPDLYLGVLFLCILPSTIQSSIAFTSIAGGNVPAALCSASASNILGMVITPALAGLLLSGGAVGMSTDALVSVLVQLLLPFGLGQVLRPRLGAWVAGHRGMLGYVDRGSILLVVYGAFGRAVHEGIWHQLDVPEMLRLLLVDAGLLATVLAGTTVICRRLGLSRADEITVVFCGSKKSLVSGIPMAKILFAGHALGLIVLPLMLFHQIQLMACAILARRYAGRAKEMPADSAA